MTKPTIKLTVRDLDVICSLKGFNRRQLSREIGYSESYLSHAIAEGEIPWKLSERVSERFQLTDDFILEMRELQRLYDSITNNE